MYGLKPVPFRLKPVPFRLKPVPFITVTVEFGFVDSHPFRKERNAGPSTPLRFTQDDRGTQLFIFRPGDRGFPGPRSGTWGTHISYPPDLGYPPAHRDRAAMNGAQLLTSQSDSSGSMSGATCR